MDHPRAYETRVFLPAQAGSNGNNDNKNGGGSLMGPLVRFIRRRCCFMWLLVSAIFASQIWFWTPVLLGEERVRELGIEGEPEPIYLEGSSII